MSPALLLLQSLRSWAHHHEVMCSGLHIADFSLVKLELHWVMLQALN